MLEVNQRNAERGRIENCTISQQWHSPDWDFFASSPLSSSLSICGNDPPKQNKGSIDATAPVAVVVDSVSFVKTFVAETSFNGLVLAVNSRATISSSNVSLSLGDSWVLPLQVMRLTAYFLFMELFLVISSRRFKLHSARLLAAFLSSVE